MREKYIDDNVAIQNDDNVDLGVYYDVLCSFVVVIGDNLFDWKKKRKSVTADVTLISKIPEKYIMYICILAPQEKIK